jgi:damage-control phosphatase, subfamily I
MQTHLECLPCFVRQAAESLPIATDDPALRENALRRILRSLADLDWKENAPAIAQRLQRIIREETRNADPYRAIKERMNRLAAELLPQCHEFLSKSPDPVEAVVRCAVAGNLLDCGARTRIEPEMLPQLFADLQSRPFSGDAAGLFRAAEKAGRILYLADNAGEIVFDRLLIDALPKEKITVAVRGSAVLNDALLEDACAAGLPDSVLVMGNGSDAPGTILEDCTPEFRAMFEKADLIISKGQGNFETLSQSDAPIFFLFTVKCPLVAKQVGSPIGTMICIDSRVTTLHPH